MEDRQLSLDEAWSRATDPALRAADRIEAGEIRQAGLDMERIERARQRLIAAGELVLHDGVYVLASGVE